MCIHTHNCIYAVRLGDELVRRGVWPCAVAAPAGAPGRGTSPPLRSATDRAHPTPGCNHTHRRRAQLPRPLRPPRPARHGAHGRASAQPRWRHPAPRGGRRARRRRAAAARRCRGMHSMHMQCAHAGCTICTVCTSKCAHAQYAHAMCTCTYNVRVCLRLRLRLRLRLHLRLRLRLHLRLHAYSQASAQAPAQARDLRPKPCVSCNHMHPSLLPYAPQPVTICTPACDYMHLRGHSTTLRSVASPAVAASRRLPPTGLRRARPLCICRCSLERILSRV